MLKKGLHDRFGGFPPEITVFTQGTRINTDVLKAFYSMCAPRYCTRKTGSTTGIGNGCDFSL